MESNSGRRLRSYDPAYHNTAPPVQKEISELLQDPGFISILLSLTFSLGVFFYFFYKLMHGIREDYRKQKKMRDEAERRAQLGLDDDEEEEEEEGNEKQKDEGKKDAKAIESMEDKIKRIAAETEVRKKQEQKIQGKNKQNKKDSDDEDDDHATQKKEVANKPSEKVDSVRQRKSKKEDI
jgi:hypothetical protein